MPGAACALQYSPRLLPGMLKYGRRVHPGAAHGFTTKHT